MRLMFLTANQVWAFVWGDQIITIDNKYGDRDRFFTTRREAVERAAKNGLAVSRSGVVSSMVSA